MRAPRSKPETDHLRPFGFAVLALLSLQAVCVCPTPCLGKLITDLNETNDLLQERRARIALLLKEAMHLDSAEPDADASSESFALAFLDDRGSPRLWLEGYAESETRFRSSPRSFGEVRSTANSWSLLVLPAPSTRIDRGLSARISNIDMSGILFEQEESLLNSSQRGQLVILWVMLVVVPMLVASIGFGSGEFWTTLASNLTKLTFAPLLVMVALLLLNREGFFAEISQITLISLFCSCVGSWLGVSFRRVRSRA